MNNIFGTDHPAYPVVENCFAHPRAEDRRQSSQPRRSAATIRTGCAGTTSASRYLDQLQYADAMHAFEQVVKLRPDYADGYINIGLTYIEWEKYSIARAPASRRR